MKIEFIKAYEDRTWDTEVIDIPDSVTEEEITVYELDGARHVRQQIDNTSPEWDSAIIAWCHGELYGQAQYRKVVYWGIYNSEPEQEETNETT